MRNPDKIPALPDPVEKLLVENELVDSRREGYPDRKRSRNFIRKPDIHSWVALTS
jgi:hypothetical protein